MSFEKLIVSIKMRAIKKPVSTDNLALIPLRLWLIELVHVLIRFQVVLVGTSILLLLVSKSLSNLLLVFLRALIDCSSPEVLVQVVKDINARNLNQGIVLGLSKCHVFFKKVRE